MSGVPQMYDVPPLGEPFLPRGVRGVALVLDEFAPTHLDAWLGRAALDPIAVADGKPGDDVTARALVVRHAGDVRSGRRGWFGARRRLAAVHESAPPPQPLLGVVVERQGTTLLWLPDRDPARLAVELSRRDWREHL